MFVYLIKQIMHGDLNFFVSKILTLSGMKIPLDLNFIDKCYQPKK